MSNELVHPDYACKAGCVHCRNTSNKTIGALKRQINTNEIYYIYI